jgi:hypothetical protein
VWTSFAAAEPGADFTRIFPYVESSAPAERSSDDGPTA